jgi:hypothetical protein
VTLKLIQPGKPKQDGYIESFNGKFRDECLNKHWFSTLAEARAIVTAWRRDCNEHRPHSSIGYLTPAEYGERHRSRRDAVQTIRNRSASVGTTTSRLSSTFSRSWLGSNCSGLAVPARQIPVPTVRAPAARRSRLREPEGAIGETFPCAPEVGYFLDIQPLGVFLND